MSLSAAKQYAALGLLKVKRFRSSFRASLRKQLDSWLAGESKYDSPFSWKQWECLLANIPNWEIKRIDEAIYYAR